MGDDDYTAEIGAVISGMLSLLSWLWNIEPLKLISTLFLGSFTTFFIQSKLQDRAEKRKISRDIIEKIYGSMYDEMNIIKEKLLLNIEHVYTSLVGGGEYSFKLNEGTSATWNRIQNLPEFFTVPLKLRKDYELIIERAVWINNSIDDLIRILNEYVFKVIGEDIFKNYIPEDSTMSFEGGVPDISYRSSTGKGLFSRELVKYILLENEPIEELKEIFPTLDKDRCFFSLHIFSDLPGSPKKYSTTDIPLWIINDAIGVFLEKGKEKAIEYQEINEYFEKKKKLESLISKNYPIIKKHIEKYFPIEKI